MQYARIVVDRPISCLNELAYSIPALLLADIRVGQLVEVGVRGRSARGVIVSITRKGILGKIEPITRIISSGAVINQRQIKFFQKISEFYFASLSDSIFYFLPPKVKNIDVHITQNEIITNKIKYIYGSTFQRFEWYKKVIKNKLKTIIIIFPELAGLHSFSDSIITKHLIYTGKLNARDRWNVYKSVNQQPAIVLATRIGIGLPVNSPCLLIIDQPNHPAYKEDHRPKYNLTTGLNILQKYFGNVIVGTDIPSLREVINYNLNSVAKQNIIIHTSNELLPNSIIDRLKKYPRVLFVVPQKGEWGGLFCQQCHTILRCIICNKPISQLDIQNVFCFGCKKMSSGIQSCPICKSYRFSGFGIGSGEIKKRLEKYRDKQIVEFNPNYITESNQKFACIIATNQILSLPILKFDIVVCLGFDNLLDITKYNQEELIFTQLLRYSLLGNRTYLLTRRPDHRVFNTLNNGNYIDLYQKLADERKYNFPPFSREIDLILKNIKLPKIIDTIVENSLLSYKITSNNKTITKIFLDDKGQKEIYKNLTRLNKYYSINPDPR